MCSVSLKYSLLAVALL